MAPDFRLRELLKEKGWKSESDFAEKIGERPNTINDICRGVIKRLPTKTIDAICEELDCEPGDWMKRAK